jgi:hypothetical protein
MTNAPTTEMMLVWSVAQSSNRFTGGIDARQAILYERRKASAARNADGSEAGENRYR